MKDLQGKKAFVTGGASGIGLAMATSLARQGVDVAIADIDEAAAARACEGLVDTGVRTLAVGCDVTSEESLVAAADRVEAELGSVHLLLNNAGAFTVVPLEQSRRSDWDWLLEINVLGTVNGLRTFLPRMRAHGEPAHIVNTASVSGHIPTPGLSIYTATKFAVVGLTECLRLELAESPIGVSLLCPGIVRTGLVETSKKHRPDRHGGSDAEPDSPLKPVVESGTDPAELGERVVQAIRDDQFYVLTHPDLRPAFQGRFDEIMAAYPEG